MATNEHKAAPMQMNEYKDVPAQEFEVGRAAMILPLMLMQCRRNTLWIL
jgi:hypothetical protein